MNKIKLIILREYLTRVKKKSFLIITILGPLLFAGLMIVPAWMALQNTDIQNIEVIDNNGLFVNNLENTETINFYYSDKDIQEAKEGVYESHYTAILYIPKDFSKHEITLYYKKQPGALTLKHIETNIENVVENNRLQKLYNISLADLQSIKPDIKIKTVYRDEKGNEETKENTVNMVLGYAGAILIYMFIFMYGVQVMRGVIEEKTNRIVEVIISSVKPFELMMGKIIGIALVGLTQFTLWVVLTAGIAVFGQGLIMSKVNQMQSVEQMVSQSANSAVSDANLNKQMQVKKVMEVIRNIPFTRIILTFLFYFIFGYLMYAALFAAVGSAVDSEADTQQFIMPITIPLVLSIVMAQFIIMNPESNLAFWMSIFPLTSPIVMMIRVPFGVEWWELALSMLLLIGGFIATTWLAGKIYRTGILMYGKKVTYKELWKWLKF
ncbi:MAG TPA: ABC transporter permease [Flavobacteriales bacterium]|nr:ABC transporter permease [Flavobacteriales bacterium]